MDAHSTAPPFLRSAKDAREVVVSFGELQTFKVTPDDTFAALVIRASRRWQVDPGQCECQVGST
jgi:hypothetical protein